jgi:hypothetical protein
MLERWSVASRTSLNPTHHSIIPVLQHSSFSSGFGCADVLDFDVEVKGLAGKRMV